MVQIEKDENAFNGEKLIAISDGTLHRGEKTGIVQMDIRLSDFKSEGHCVLISVFDETLDKLGDYTPLDFEKEELSQLINFLQQCYDHLDLVR